MKWNLLLKLVSLEPANMAAQETLLLSSTARQNRISDVEGSEGTQLLSWDTNGVSSSDRIQSHC